MKGVFHAKLILVVLAGLVLGAAALLQAQTATTTTTFRASDPGVRGDPPGAGGPFQFGRSKHKLYARKDHKVTFQDAAGVEAQPGPGAAHRCREQFGEVDGIAGVQPQRQEARGKGHEPKSSHGEFHRVSLPAGPELDVGLV